MGAGEGPRQPDGDGTIKVFAKGKHVRTEYEDDGDIEFYKDGKHVRTEYAPGHDDHGEIEFFEDDEHVRTEYGTGGTALSNSTKTASGSAPSTRRGTTITAG